MRDLSAFMYNFLVMHDNPRSYASRITRQVLEELRIRAMKWPTFSQGMLPIEHLMVRARNAAPSNIDELSTALFDEWDRIPQDAIKKLLKSMKNIFITSCHHG